MWAARAKLDWVLARAVMAGVVQIDFTMGDVQINADKSLLDTLVGDAQHNRLP